MSCAHLCFRRRAWRDMIDFLEATLTYLHSIFAILQFETSSLMNSRHKNPVQTRETIQFIKLIFQTRQWQKLSADT